MTSEDDKTVHQQSINTVDVTVGVGDGAGGLFVHGSLEAVKRVQAAFDEVRRLREEVALWQRHAQRGETDLLNARNERDGLAAAGAGYVAKLDKLAAGYISDRRVLRAVMGDHLAKLRRVEALPAKWRLQQRITAREADLARELATELEGALRD